MNCLKGHIRRTAVLAKNFGGFLNLQDEKIKELYLSGMFHDIGKIKVKKDILNKQGKLTDEEFEEMKKHPIYSKKILCKETYNDNVIRGVFEHHERIDGKGYPNGLKGNEISNIGKIIAICDSYEAMTSVRSYQRTKTKEEAIKEIINNLDTQFDKEYGLEFVNFIMS